MNISFDNTEIAFAHKTDKDLERARFLFSTMGIGWIVKLGTKITPWAIKAKLPINKVIKNTIFKQFVGGESLIETESVVSALQQYNVQVILDYGVEGKDGEENFEQATNEFIKVIEYAATQKNIPFISVKLTGFARFGLLEKLDAAAGNKDGAEARVDTTVLQNEEEIELKKVTNRLIKIYRTDRFQFLKDCFEQAQLKQFILGTKLVRGAYMEKERKRAEAMNYPSPIQPGKEATDNDYNDAIEFCVPRLENIFLIVASHNEFSNLYTTQLLQKQFGSLTHKHIHFSQLYGMSDNITFNLANAGCSVSKYLPFGPIKDVIPYLMRRAQENSSISGHTGRELSLIKKELKRRKEKE